MDFRILGPLEVWNDGESVAIRPGKPCALLAVLLLHANRVVSADTLVESLWGERPPSTATKALQVYVSQLRKALGRERIVTRSAGYELRVDPGEVDLDRFEHLLEAERYDEALALWRGAPLADFAYEPFAQAEIARLEERMSALLELRVDAALEAGRHASSIAELESLVREYPLRERFRAQLMLALYRSGRQADALDVYQAGRTILSEELGLEPGFDLRELQRAILAQDPALAFVERAAPEPSEHEPSVDGGSARRLREARKTVTVASCDVVVVGATLDPESLRRLTDLGHEELVPVLESHGAMVERSLGGTVTAVFGVPAVHEDDALRGVRAVAEIRERLELLRDELAQAWGSWLAPRAGLSTGEVLTGDSGDGRPSATGEPVRTAIRLQQLAETGELLLDERTLRLVRDAVDVDQLEGHARLLRVEPFQGPPTTRFDAPMVGREREQRRLSDAFEQAVGDRSCQLFTILGAPGVGKSRLVHEFVGRLGNDALVARGRCLPYGEGISYWPVVEAVRDAVGLDDTASAAENLARVAAVLDGLEGSQRNAARIGEIVGLSERASGPEDIANAVRSLVEALARQRPLVLVFDDIHWGEATFLDLVDHLAARTDGAPVLLVCIARPELLDVRQSWGGGKVNATSVLLESLSDEDSERLLEGLLGQNELSGESRQRIIEAAGGNPLFVEQMLALFLEAGRAADLAEIPPTIQALLATRLESLPDSERTAIEAASVEGKVFHEASVARLTSRGDVATGESLHGLVRRGLVRMDAPAFSGETAFRFRHLLIRDAAYESIPKERRATLHALHAAWLEEEVEARTLELDEIVGYHYEQAYRSRAALGPLDDATRELGRAGAARLGTAGRRALVRSDAPAGVNLISRGVALLSPDDPLRVELLPNVRVVQGLEDLSWADRVLTEAVEAAATKGDRRLASHALVQRAFLRLFTGSDVKPAELVDVADRAIAVFEELGDDLGLARAWRLVGQAHYLDRRAAACAVASERALVHARQAGDRFEEREISEWLAIAHILGPTPATEALDVCRRLVDESRHDDEIRADALAVMAALSGSLGRTADARKQMVEAQALTQGVDGRAWIFAFWWSSFRTLGGDPEAAERELRPTYESLKRLGEKSHFSSMAHALANVRFAQGRYDEAERLTRECEEASRANDVHSQIQWRSVRAKVIARRGAFDDAERFAREAIAIAEQSDFLPAHADALMDLADVHERAGRLFEAKAAVERAIELYEQKENVVATRRARSELERLMDAA